METFRIHGDNIIECERIVKMIIDGLKNPIVKSYLISPSTIVYELSFILESNKHDWKIILLPGFNKSGRSRWEKNIFDPLKQNGSFLDETPDAIISKETNGKEIILCAIEFCSALQAGNQAWQRSGRAYSTGRTGCPYIYIVDFVKYELDPKTRERKSPRFPNAAIPYSYINYSITNNVFVAQVYTKSEEFDVSQDEFNGFNEKNFAEKELSMYIINKMAGLDTSEIEKTILDKNLNVVMFLSKNMKTSKAFNDKIWKEIYTNNKNIVNYSIEKKLFPFHKKISEKGHHGKSKEFIKLVDNISVGLASTDLPIGIIPKNNRTRFSKTLSMIYPEFNKSILDEISKENKDLILCVIKGFKPKGDDNRPDRGILPLAAMLSSETNEIMTYLYGPVIENNYNCLLSNPVNLANRNGLWKAILSLSNYLALDVPLISSKSIDARTLLDTSSIKEHFTSSNQAKELCMTSFYPSVLDYHEDDVDTGIHYLFTNSLSDNCFEGMCNPPGGDWSGFSIINKNRIKKWLSLPRVSENGKRPDHVIQIFNIFEKPVLLVIESKEKSIDLENNVGNGLKNYINYLFKYIPSVEKEIEGDWYRGTSRVSPNDFKIVSAAAYLKSQAQANQDVLNNSNCEMLFILEPTEFGWYIEIITTTKESETIKMFIKNKILSSNEKSILIL